MSTDSSANEDHSDEEKLADIDKSSLSESDTESEASDISMLSGTGSSVTESSVTESTDTDYESSQSSNYSRTFGMRDDFKVETTFIDNRWKDRKNPGHGVRAIHPRTCNRFTPPKLIK